MIWTAADVIGGRADWAVECGDCLALLSALPDACADALVTDPPYCSGAIGEAQRVRSDGQGLRSETLRRFGWFVGDNMGTAGLVWLLRAVATEATRVVRPTGSVLIFCDWRMLPSLSPAVESAGLRYQGLVVWDKGDMGLGSGFRCQHEMVMHFTLGSPEYHDRGTPNVLRSGRVSKTDRQHHAQKPVDLLARLVRVVAPPGGVVLDPFTGSGSTGLACLDTGRQFIGFEKDAEYVALARQRLTDAFALFRAERQTQGSLFVSPAVEDHPCPGP